MRGHDDARNRVQEDTGGTGGTGEDTTYAGFGTVRPRVQIPGPRPVFELCEDLAGGCCHRVDPFEYRLRALILIRRLEVSDHRKKTAPSEQ